MKVIRHAGVDSRMIILDDQARQQMTLHFNAMFHPSWALLGMTKPVMGETLHCHAAILQARLSVRQTGLFRSIYSESKQCHGIAILMCNYMNKVDSSSGTISQVS